MEDNRPVEKGVDAIMRGKAVAAVAIGLCAAAHLRAWAAGENAPSGESVIARGAAAMDRMSNEDRGRILRQIDE
jgi:hypothetical protein